MQSLKKIWNYIVWALLLVIVLDAIVFFYIIAFPNQPLARTLQQYEPVFGMLQNSGLRSSSDADETGSPKGVRITVKVVEGDHLVALPTGHPVFSQPDSRSEIIGYSPHATRMRSLADRDGWYLLEFSFGKGWVNPYISGARIHQTAMAQKNTATASRFDTSNSDQVVLDRPKLQFNDSTRLESIFQRRQARLTEVLGKRGSADLADDPTAVDPERLKQAMDLLSGDAREIRVSDFVLYFEDDDWGRHSATLLTNLREEYQRMLSEVVPDPDDQSNAFVFLLPNMSTYRSFYPAANPNNKTINAGHYEGGLIAIHPNSYQGSSRYQTLIHEATHHYNYLLLRINNVEGLIWLDEGLATYFGFSQKTPDGKIMAGVIPGDGMGRARMQGSNVENRVVSDSPARRIAIERSRIHGDGALDVRHFINMDNADFYRGEVVSNYTRSWLLLHFFLHADGGKYRPLLFKYINKARLAPVNEKTFEEICGMTIEDFNNRWRNYVFTL